jgi:transmembrane sensor
VYYYHIMEKQFSKFINGTCSPDEFSEVLESLCTENDHGKLTTAIQKLWNNSLTKDHVNKENSQLLGKIRYRIELEESQVFARRVILYRNLLRIAAVLIIGIISSAIVFYNQPEKHSFTFVTETVTTPYGARTSFKLSDGSEVWLNSGSTISYPNQFGDQRKVELTGQAYFKVIKDGKPFEVKTASGYIEVMGTSFDVKAYPNENFETTLVEGSVKVRDRISQVATLKPGQQSVITPANKFYLSAVNTDLITSWREGKLIFVKEPFQIVAKELERWYNVKIDLQGEKLKKLGFTGTIEMESFSEVLELIKTTVPIKYQFDKKTRVLQISGK